MPIKPIRLKPNPKYNISLKALIQTKLAVQLGATIEDIGQKDFILYLKGYEVFQEPYADSTMKGIAHNARFHLTWDPS